MRYLTKSKFKLALECPAKLFYADKPQYANQKIADSFLAQLAEGGFQVGALARQYFPAGISIDTPNDETAVGVTGGYLERDQVTLFEAAFCSGTLLIRADIVVKNGPILDLYEVKAKSVGFADELGMLRQDGMPTADWKKYIADVAFQKHVISNARPDLALRAHLMLVDKTSLCPTDGLNQKFRVVREDGRRHVRVSTALSDEDLTPRLLRAINVDAACDKVLASLVGDYRFDDYIAMLAVSYAADQKIVTPPLKACGDCEFRLAPGAGPNGQLSGFRECWTHSLGWTDEDFREPTVLDIWYFQSKDKFLGAGKIKFSQLTEDDIGPKSDGKPGVSRSERQWKQVDMARQGTDRPWIDLPNLKREMDAWTFPLHFIDFETSKPAIPFKKGRRPYSGILFQFSHHTVDAAGRTRHAGEFLSARPGVFPNYDCVRELKRQLEHDRGTIFRYHNHENTFLCEVYDQLRLDPDDIPDREGLCGFIRAITTSTDKTDPWTGERTMVDLYKLVERYHYDPATNGSVSLKYVLPAVLNSSGFLKEKYSHPIYGAPGGIQSLNFKDHTWIQFDDAVRDVGSEALAGSPPYEGGVGFSSPPARGGVAVPMSCIGTDEVVGAGDGVVLYSETPGDRQSKNSEPRTPNSEPVRVIDPYKLLPPLFTDEDPNDYAAVMEMDKIKDGGAAMTAYCKLQFEDIPDAARQAVESALLKYCELDTLAMVMIYEAWRAALDEYNGGHKL